MSKALPNPDDNVVIVRRPGHGTALDTKTYGDVALNSLTAEALRDIARNESVSKAWRKAAVKRLMRMNHPFVWSSFETRGLMVEIKEEQEAEREVQDVVEQAIEEPLED